MTESKLKQLKEILFFVEEDDTRCESLEDKNQMSAGKQAI